MLARWLTRESERNRKRRRNLTQLQRDMVALGFDGSYDSAAAFARDWWRRERERANQARRGVYVPLRAYLAHLALIAQGRVVAKHDWLFHRDHNSKGGTVHD